MEAALYRFRAELRTRWRNWVGVALLAGLFYGAVLAAVAGGRRTDTIVARALRRAPSPDIFMVPAFSRNTELLDFDAIARFPEVVRASNLPSFLNSDGWDVTGSADTAGVGQGRVLAGRLPRKGATDEAAVNFVGRDRRHVSVGQTVELHMAGLGYGGEGDPPPGPTAKVKIVGVVANLADFASVATPGLYLTSAFTDTYQSSASAFDIFVFGLRHVDADLPAFRRHMNTLTGGQSVLFVEARNDYAQVQRSFHVQAASLFVLAAFLALVALLVVTQTLVRLGFFESADHDVLRTLGMTRAQRRALAALRGILLAAVATGTAVTAAIVTSSALPFGRPRMAEVSPGVWAPLGLLALGAAIIFATVVAQSGLAALTSRTQRVTRSRAVDRVTAVAPGATTAIGVRFALEPGHGRDAVPIRSTLGAATLGVMAVVMALTVSASLGRLLDTPRLYGWGWDATADVSSADSDARDRMESLPGVAAVGYGTVSAEGTIGSVSAEVISMEPGPIDPILLEGRAPVRDDEIALARKTFRSAHARIGSRVAVAFQGRHLTRRMRVVGVVVLPVESDISTLGEGGLVSGSGLRVFIPEAEPDTAFVRYTPGADTARVSAAVGALVGGDGVVLPTEPTSLVDFGSVRSLPYVLGGVLALLAEATIAHLVLSSVRRRRRDLAMLKTLGLVSHQLRAVVVWQALTLTLVSLAAGIPLGIAAGRWIWLLFARQVGFLGEPVFHPLPLVAACAAAAALACVIAAIAGRGASRTPAAVVLRAE